VSLLTGIAGSNTAGGMDVCFEYCVLSGRSLCDGMITRLEEFCEECLAGPRVCVCVCVCVYVCVYVYSLNLNNEDGEAHWGCCATGGKLSCLSTKLNGVIFRRGK